MCTHLIIELQGVWCKAWQNCQEKQTHFSRWRDFHTSFLRTNTISEPKVSKDAEDLNHSIQQPNWHLWNTPLSNHKTRPLINEPLSMRMQTRSYWHKRCTSTWKATSAIPQRVWVLLTLKAVLCTSTCHWVRAAAAGSSRNWTWSPALPIAHPQPHHTSTPNYPVSLWGL